MSIEGDEGLMGRKDHVYVCTEKYKHTVKSSYNNKEEAAKVIPNAAIVKMVVVEAELAA